MATMTLFESLKAILAQAHAPYSGFRVAAAAVDERDQAHFGVNVENQSYPVGTCAEAGAISALRVAGGTTIKQIYLLSEPNIGIIPCGACCQRLAELGTPDTQVLTFDPAGKATVYSLHELFPHAFGFRSIDTPGDT